MRSETNKILRSLRSSQIDSGESGKGSSSKSINLGPLELQGPSIGIEGIGFKDGMLVVTVGIGVDMAGLNFGSSGSGKATQKTEKQEKSGITAELKNVLGTFDMKVDAFGLLSGNFNIEPSGKFGLMVGSMEVDVPDAVNVTATGIRVAYDPDYVEGSGSNGPGAQKLVEVDEATITFPKIKLQGKMKNLIVRTDGFSLGLAELCYGCTGPDQAKPLNDDGTQAAGEPAIKIGSFLEFDDIRIGVQNFDVTFGDKFKFGGKIYIASGGAEFLPGKAGLRIH